ncbi:GH25 family lysozyme [Faecalibacterium prausnitzii]|jgi:lysozyme|uniref:GH25 family lysozyme n=1 Tax=Faecalibacterium prausnitzii TaxID=853 RepID=UPI002907E823|nr:GH25 family lysozyme [Faecalibacterium prausnitzii]
MKKTFWKKCTVRGTAAALALALTFSLGAPLALAAQPEEPETAAAAQTQEVQETDRPTLLPETPELAAEDPEAPPAQATEAEENSVNQHTPENSVVLTPEQISEALDAGALNEAEAQCLDFGSENGFWTWLVNFLFGWLDKAEPVYSGWRTTGGKTYYYSSTTHEPVTGIQSIDDKLYYFDADGVLQKGKTFGVDVSKYQKNIDWEQIKKAGVSFVIVRIGYRGYGASGALVLDPMFEEHFTNVKNAGLKVGVYFFSQATTEEEAKEEAFACAYVLNGRKLDYPIFFDTEASGASGGSGRADGLGVADRTKCAVAFCEEVKANGYKPGVYASTLWYRNRVDLSSLTKYTIWNAHYGVASSPIDCALWQGTCTARLPGYKGDLDVNISYIG